MEKIAFYIHKNQPNEHSKKQSIISSESSSKNPQSNSWLDEIRGFGLHEDIITSQILNNYEQDYIVQTLKYCKSHFKTTAVQNKSGFFIKALENGYYKHNIETEESKKQKAKLQQDETSYKNQAGEQQKIEDDALILKLREQYMSPDFIETVLAEYELNFLHHIMKKDWEQGKINKFLQGFIDRKLREECGG